MTAGTTSPRELHDAATGTGTPAGADDPLVASGGSLSRAEVMPLGIVAALLVAAVGSWAITGLVRRYALTRAILDLPNARSSHTRPTPRGGGIAIAVVSLAGIALFGLLGIVSGPVAVALLGGGAAVAGIGWIDDHAAISSGLRGTVHLLSAAWAVVWLGGLETLSLGETVVQVGAAGWVLAIVGIAWATNLYNFMDGIDGIAGSEAVYLGVVGGGLLLATGAVPLGSVALLVAAAAAGFLVWNWSPAAIFMGDVGSGFLGFVFGTLAIASETARAVPLLAWMILAGVFLFDASVTLVRRMARGERWMEAHRSHAYQRLVQSGWAHSSVVVAMSGANLVLGGLAAIAVLSARWLPAASVTAVALLTLLFLLIERRRPQTSANPRPV